MPPQNKDNGNDTWMLTPPLFPKYVRSLPVCPADFRIKLFRKDVPNPAEQILTIGVSTISTFQQNHLSSVWTVNASGRSSQPLKTVSSRLTCISEDADCPT